MTACGVATEAIRKQFSCRCVPRRCGRLSSPTFSGCHAQASVNDQAGMTSFSDKGRDHAVRSAIATIATDACHSCPFKRLIDPRCLAYRACVEVHAVLS